MGVPPIACDVMGGAPIHERAAEAASGGGQRRQPGGGGARRPAAHDRGRLRAASEVAAGVAPQMRVMILMLLSDLPPPNGAESLSAAPRRRQPGVSRWSRSAYASVRSPGSSGTRTRLEGRRCVVEIKTKGEIEAIRMAGHVVAETPHSDRAHALAAPRLYDLPT